MSEVSAPDKNVLRVEDLVMYFRTQKGAVRAVDKVSFDLGYNEAIVVLGESGCGKTSLAKAILRLLPRNIDTYTGKVYVEKGMIRKIPFNHRGTVDFSKTLPPIKAPGKSL